MCCFIWRIYVQEKEFGFYLGGNTGGDGGIGMSGLGGPSIHESGL
jgi:hypothetical protein